jgi:hypothetical protein
VYATAAGPLFCHYNTSSVVENQPSGESKEWARIARITFSFPEQDEDLLLWNSFLDSLVQYFDYIPFLFLRFESYLQFC